MRRQMRVFTTQEVAQHLHKSPATVRNMARRGDLPAIVSVSGRQRFFLEEDVEKVRQASRHFESSGS